MLYTARYAGYGGYSGHCIILEILVFGARVRVTAAAPNDLAFPGNSVVKKTFTQSSVDPV